MYTDAIFCIKMKNLIWNHFKNCHINKTQMNKPKSFSSSDSQPRSLLHFEAHSTALERTFTIETRNLPVMKMINAFSISFPYNGKTAWVEKWRSGTSVIALTRVGLSSFRRPKSSTNYNRINPINKWPSRDAPQKYDSIGIWFNLGNLRKLGPLVKRVRHVAAMRCFWFCSDDELIINQSWRRERDPT